MAVPERYPGERLGILGHVPPFAERVLVAGPGSTLLGGLLKRQRNGWVGALVPQEENLAVATQVLDGAWQRLPEGARFDCIIATAPVMLDTLSNALDAEGMLLQLVPLSQPLPAVQGLFTRHAWPSAEDLASQRLAALVHVEYDALIHAKRLEQAGKYEAAYWVLEQVPPDAITSPEQHVSIHLEKLRITATLLEKGRAQHPLGCFYDGQHAFYKITEAAPDLHEPYVHQARAWAAIGNPAKGARLLRTHAHAYPDHAPETPPLPETTAEADTPGMPPWAPATGRLPRLLFLMNPRMHYGLDVLYDGLVHLLGVDRVVDFPPKPSLHGRAEPRFAHYPCVLQWPDPKTLPTWASVAEALATGAFDAVLLGDCECTLPQDRLRTLIDAAGDTPVYLVDAVDEPFDLRAAVCVHANIGVVAGYFKREMLTCWDYGPGVWPLPFAYPEGRVPAATDTERTEPLFWAGHRGSGLRNVYLDFIARRFGFRFEATYPQEAYARRLAASRIGLNGFGYGYDTVRYWELPAHGCMLLSERMPIHIPHNFVDGESAVFFDDLPDLEAKLDHYLRHPDETARIAAAGRTHLMAHHTSTARARQLLGVLLKG